MPISIQWQEVMYRLIWTVVAGLIIGINRGEHGRPAGMRTTLLVCLAASLSMILANLLMPTAGKSQDSFVQLDLMRLPLGVLSGMGFIGAGAILRKDNLVLGVTTAATMWFTTLLGLCFGSGQIALGAVALCIGVATLWGLKYVENAMRHDVRATLTLTMSKDGPSDDEIREMIQRERCTVISWGMRYIDHARRRELSGQIQRRIIPGETRPPAFVVALAEHPQIEEIHWNPQGTGKSGT